MSLFDQLDERRRRRQLVGNHLEGQPHAAASGHRRQLLEAAHERAAVVVAGARRTVAARRGARPAVVRAPPRRRRASPAPRRLRPAAAPSSAETRLRPSFHAPSTYRAGDRRMHRVQAQARVVEPLGERRPRRGDRGSRNASAARTARSPRSRARRCRPGARDRAGRRGTGAWRCRRAFDHGHARGFYAAHRPGSASSSGSRPKRGSAARLASDVGQRARHVLDVDRVVAAWSSGSRTCRAPSGCAAAPSGRTAAGTRRRPRASPPVSAPGSRRSARRPAAALRSTYESRSSDTRS